MADSNSELEANLRQKAEEILKKRQLKSDKQLSEADIYKLIHELEVHQIELEMQNEELLKFHAEKDRFFSILAHDLRSPFSSFLGLTEILADDLIDMTPHDIQKMAYSLRKSAINIYHLIENLLEWARIQRGLVEINPETAPLNNVILNSIEPLSDFAMRKELEIQINVPANLYIKADLSMIESTLRNLLSNALKFSFHGGNVSISAMLIKSNYIQISVADQGIGMNAGLLSNLFHIDRKTGRKGTEEEPSTGLGLLLCKDFVEKNGGMIWAESTEGKGSTFSFTLPADNDAAQKII
jgi:signal transduction histidine kinase